MIEVRPTKRDLYVLVSFFLVLMLLASVITSPILFYKKTSSDFLKAKANQLESHVRFFSELDPGRGYQDIDSLNQAALYIENIFSQYCESTERQIYTVEGKEFSNIICSFNKDSANRIVVGAHYDSYSSMPGADDNASGVAGLLELARLLNENGTQQNVKSRIDLVAYTLEEPPFFSSEEMGSYKHVEQLRNGGVSLKVVIILEMIGYFSEEPGSQSLPVSILKPLYPDEGSFIAVIGKLGQGDLLHSVKRKMLEASSVDVRSFSGPTFIKTIDFSDHRSYWLNNYPAVMITDTSFYRNKNYHTENDLPDTLNYSYMAEVINGVYWAIINI